MNCRKCGKRIMQYYGEWSPEEPDITRRGYYCTSCHIGYVEIYSRIEKKVIRVEETDYNVKVEKQTSLVEWM